MKKKYMMFGFRFLNDVFKKNLSDYDFFYYDDSTKFNFIKNYLLYRKIKKSRIIDQFDVVHVNAWQNFLQYERKKGQVSIAESHGIHIGLDLDIGVSQSKYWMQKFLSIGISKYIHFKLRRAIENFDIHYVSIPNALPYAKEIRSDSLWLPNPIDTSLFKNYPRNKFVESPQILFPTRFHDVKNPTFAFNIFDEILKIYPDATLHIIDYPKRFTHANKYYKYLVESHKKNIIIHPFMKRNNLPKFYSQFDIILGSFNPNYYYANLNLIEMEAMACKVPVVTHDKYELIKKDLDELPELTLKLLENPKFKNSYINKCYEYIIDVHSEKSVCKIHQKNLRKFS